MRAEWWRKSRLRRHNDSNISVLKFLRVKQKQSEEEQNANDFLAHGVFLGYF